MGAISNKNKKDDQEEYGENLSELVASPHIHEVPRASLPSMDIEAISMQVPSNLPPRDSFFGRVTELAEIQEALNNRDRIVIIEGIGGIGKTSLVLEAAHRFLIETKEARQNGVREVSSKLFQGFIWLSARDRGLTIDSVADMMGRVLNFSFVSRVPIAEKLSAIDKLLRTNHYLVIVDNFETLNSKQDHEVIRFLLNLPEQTKLLITSRYRLTVNASRIDLKSLNQNDALDLMRAWGRDNKMESVAKAESRSLIKLFEATGGLPLAIKTTLGQMKQRGQSLETVLSYLDRAKGDLFDNIFQHSWSLLENHSALILKSMPLFVESASIEAIRAVARVQNDDLANGLGQLVEMCLLDASDSLDEGQRRYRIHPLTRSFALRLLHQEIDFEKDARERAARYFLAFVDQYSAWEDTRGLDHLGVELANILAYMDWAIEYKDYKTLVAFHRGMYNFFWARGYWHYDLIYGNFALEAAKSIGDIESQAWILVESLGWIYFCQGDLGKAQVLYKEGRSLFQVIGSRRGLARTCNYFGRLYATRGEYRDAKLELEAGLNLAPDTMSISFCESAIGDVAFELGDFKEAKSHYLKVKDIREKTGDESRLASVLCDLGEVAIKLVELSAARSYFDQSFKVSHRIGRTDVEARSLRGLAKVEKVSGNLIEAESLAQVAADAFMRLGAERELRVTQLFIQGLKSNQSSSEEQERSEMITPEDLAVPIIKEALSYLLGEVKNVLKERRKRKGQQAEMPKAKPEEAIKQETSPKEYIEELKGKQFDKALLREVQEQLRLIEIESQNWHRANRQIAQQGGEAFAMPPTLAAREMAEEQISQHSLKLKQLLDEITGIPVEVKGLLES